MTTTRNDRPDLDQQRAALDRLIDIGKQIHRLGVEWPSMPRDTWGALLAAHHDATVEEATLRGVPQAIATLQWREVHDRDVPLTTTERAALEQWTAAQQAERDGLQRGIDASRSAHSDPLDSREK